jgi:hypothetical protein
VVKRIAASAAAIHRVVLLKNLWDLGKLVESYVRTRASLIWLRWRSEFGRARTIVLF